MASWGADCAVAAGVQELDLVAINTLGLMAASSAVVWGIAPNRSFAAPRMPWQRVLSGMPSNIFDVCGPQRQYTLGSRFASYAAKVGRPTSLPRVVLSLWCSVPNLSMQVSWQGMQ